MHMWDMSVCEREINRAFHIHEYTSCTCIYIPECYKAIAHTLLYLPNAPSGRVCGASALDGKGDGWVLVWLGTDVSGAPATCWPLVASSASAWIQKQY